MTSELGTALGCSDVRYEGGDVGKGSDRVEVDADDEAAPGHVLLGDLKPSTWSSAEIDDAFRLGEEVIFAVEVDQLAVRVTMQPQSAGSRSVSSFAARYVQSRTSSVSLFLGELVKLVETALARLLVVFPHSDRS